MEQQSRQNGGSSTALARTSEAGLTMVVPPTEAEERLRELQDFVRRNMVEGEDFGVIPGTKGQDGKPPKKTLLQPGAQKLAEIYGLAVTFEDTRPPIERWEGNDPMFVYFKRALITRRSDGQFLGSGIGSCNSKEKKYASRWVFDNQVPDGLDIDKLPRKEGVSKRNGRAFVQYQVPNPEIFDLVNTIEKMACKRALVAAVIGVTRSAGIFTQDMEDLAREREGDDGEAQGRPGPRRDVQDAEFEEASPVKPASSPQPPKRDVRAYITRTEKALTAADVDALVTEAGEDPKLIAWCVRAFLRLALTPADVDAAGARFAAVKFPAEVATKLETEAVARRRCLVAEAITLAVGAPVTAKGVMAVEDYLGQEWSIARIARYGKDETGGMDEVQVGEVAKRLGFTPAANDDPEDFDRGA